MKYSSQAADDTITCYFNLWVWSSADGNLNTDEHGLQFVGQNGKTFNIPFSQLEMASFSFYSDQSVGGPISGVWAALFGALGLMNVTYRLLLKTKHTTYRLHYLKEETGMSLKAIFRQHAVTIRDSQNDKNTKQVKRKKQVLNILIILFGLGLIAVTVFIANHAAQRYK